MEKSWYYLLATGAVFSMTACQNEELTGGKDSQTVSITASLDGKTTRTGIEDTGLGTKVDRCVLQVYEEDGTPYGSQIIEDVKNQKASFENIRLISGKKYKFVFWADKKDANNGSVYYNTTDLSNISLKSNDNALNNDERDAFTGTLSDVNLDDKQSYNVTLTRPFGQVNLLSKDLESLPANKYPSKVTVTYENIYTAFNAVNEQVAGQPSSATYTADIFNQQDKDAAYFSMNYVFAKPKPEDGTQGDLINLKTQFLDANGNKVGVEKSISNIPVYRNWRTNVTSNYLTNGGSVDVTIDPNFWGVTPSTPYTTDADLIKGGYFTVDQDFDDINISSVQDQLKGDVVLSIDKAVKTIYVGTKAKPAVSKTVTIYLRNGVPAPKIAVAKDAQYLPPVHVVANAEASALDGFVPGGLKSIEDLQFNGVKFKNDKGIAIDLENSSVNHAVIKFNNINAKTTNGNFFTVRNLDETSSVTVTGSTVETAAPTGDSYGFKFVNCKAPVTITGNTITANNDAAVFVGYYNNPNSPKKLVISDNTLSTKGNGIIVQEPGNEIEITNNVISKLPQGSSSSMIAIWRFRKAKTPTITVTGNTINPNSDATECIYVGHATVGQWAIDNEEGSTAKVIIKDNIKGNTYNAQWFFDTAKANNLELLKGSDVATPYKK